MALNPSYALGSLRELLKNHHLGSIPQSSRSSNTMGPHWDQSSIVSRSSPGDSNVCPGLGTTGTLTVQLADGETEAQRKAVVYPGSYCESGLMGRRHQPVTDPVLHTLSPCSILPPPEPPWNLIVCPQIPWSTICKAGLYPNEWLALFPQWSFQ